MSEIEIVNTVKRPRKANFSPAECTTILNMAEENLSIIRDKFSNVLTNQKKAEVWKRIVQQVNSHGVAKRTVSDVKDKWRSMVMGVKKDYSMEKQGRKKTGGEQQPAPPFNQSTRIIIKCFGDEPSFSGIPGGIESGAEDALATFEG